MTWGMHAIGHLELGQEDEASKLFNRSYLPYVQVGLYLCLIVLFFCNLDPAPFLHVDRGAGRWRGGQLHHRDGRVPTGKTPLWNKLFRTATTRLLFMDILG